MKKEILRTLTAEKLFKLHSSLVEKGFKKDAETIVDFVQESIDRLGIPQNEEAKARVTY